MAATLDWNAARCQTFQTVRLANLEDNLGKLLEAVQRGRNKLQGVQEE